MEESVINSWMLSFFSDLTVRVIFQVVGHICRSTIVPDRRKAHVSGGKQPEPKSLSIQSISLGDHLAGVTRDPFLDNMKVHHDFLQPRDARTKDVHFFFKAVGYACENFFFFFLCRT